MKSCCCSRAAAGSVLAALLACLLCFPVHARFIRLRNGAIPTQKGNLLAPAKAGGRNEISGLLLLQFHQPPSPEQRAQLAAAGLDLLQYVPDDAFLARAKGVRLDQLRALPFVEWVGEYRPAQKVHRGLRPQKGKTLPNEPVGVSILLAPRAQPAEVATARAFLDQVQQESRLRSGTILRGKMNPNRVDALAASDAVLWIEPAHDMKMFDEVASKIVAGDGGTHTLLTQSLGYDGSGVKVAVADSGLNNGDAATMHPDLFGRTPAFFQYGTLTDAADEHSHGTHVAGIIAGNGATGETDENGYLYGLGVAPGAAIIAQRIFDGVGNYEPPPSFERLTRDAVRSGADIGSNSWGDDTQGRYDTSAMEFDDLVRDADALTLGDQQYILEFSAGNAGPGAQTIGSPAVAKNVIATGASENDREDFIIYADGIDTMADFSSRGPCEDGRIKPDVVAPGTWISSLQSASATAEYAWAEISDYYQYQGGTSQAGPHASGAAAVFVQYYRQTHAGATPSPALVKAALINSALDMDNGFGTGPVPNNDEGWGRVDLPWLIDSGFPAEYLDQSVLLTNTQVFEKRILVGSTDTPLSITLTYTDVPGFPGAVPALVNDLDLEVVGPDGTVFRGNQFLNGESEPNAPHADHINNVEGVRIAEPVAGQYVIRVRAANVVEDARQDTPDVDQDFALVISADLAPPGTAIISMDKRAYRAPSQVKIAVTDWDQAGHSSVNINLRSTTEAEGLALALPTADPSGVFTGAVATATGPAQPDNYLQISQGDLIEATYFDASAGLTRRATATADLLPPVLSNVAITNAFGQAYVSWTSDEPANSLVVYGPGPSPGDLTLSASNSDLTTSHSLTLGGLVPGTTYSCYLVSADQAGNVATKDNGGAFFTFVVAATPPILLVDQYTNDWLTLGAPALSGYTDPLNQAGMLYDTWDVASRGEPSLEVLSTYRAVIFRMDEFGVPSMQQLLAISNYVQSGGSLLIASMEGVTRLNEIGATGFIHDVLHVQSFVEDTGVEEILGSTLDPVTSGLDITMDYTVYDDLWGGYPPGDLSDTIEPGPGATAFFRDPYDTPVGLRWPGLGQDGMGRVVYLSFPLDAIPAGAERAEVLRRLLLFLAPGVGNSSSVAFNSPSYNLPSAPAVEVGDSHAAGRGSVTVFASSTTQTNGIPVSLRETSTPGRFIGSFPLISSTNPPANGQVLASPGDSISVDYYDALSSNLFSASAVIDTTPPTLTNVTADPAYVNAIISWEASEPVDALVEFGPSVLLGRSAYVADFGEFPEVSLPFLQPDTVYYYRVTSRDPAGNSVRDDNQGKFYTFRTLAPVLPPWSDNMDTGAPGWTTFVDDSLGLGAATPNWTLGVPHNSLGTNNAPSPPNAWGCNLNGDPVDFAQCFLISPAIYLTNGNVAKLTFTHNYDFTDQSGYDIEMGEVDVVTEDGGATPIAQYGDSSYGWQTEELDVSAWSGQIVYIVWNYFLFSLETGDHPGWLVDDVAISVSNMPPGTVIVSNNLWQASYVLSGGAYKKGKGSTVISNAPPGEYIIEFADLPYYVTPPAQTNTLAPGGTLVFQAAYTFPDVNGNGISDLWEQRFFGNVSTNRTRFTDSDGDGMSDYAEFIAGTDPNSPPARVRLSAQRAAGMCRLQWPTASGQQYRVQASTNLVAWTIYSGWMEATGTVARLDVPIQGGGAPSFFRLQVGATNSPVGLAPNLSLAAQRLPSGAVQLQWPSSAGRAYRVSGTADFQSWAPVSGWIQATSGKTFYSVPAPLSAARQFYRIEVSP